MQFESVAALLIVLLLASVVYAFIVVSPRQIKLRGRNGSSSDNELLSTKLTSRLLVAEKQRGEVDYRSITAQWVSSRTLRVSCWALYVPSKFFNSGRFYAHFSLLLRGEIEFTDVGEIKKVTSSLSLFYDVFMNQGRSVTDDDIEALQCDRFVFGDKQLDGVRLVEAGDCTYQGQRGARIEYEVDLSEPSAKFLTDASWLNQQPKEIAVALSGQYTLRATLERKFLQQWAETFPQRYNGTIPPAAKTQPPEIEADLIKKADARLGELEGEFPRTNYLVSLLYLRRSLYYRMYLQGVPGKKDQLVYVPYHGGEQTVCRIYYAAGQSKPSQFGIDDVVPVSWHEIPAGTFVMEIYNNESNNVLRDRAYHFDTTARGMAVKMAALAHNTNVTPTGLTARGWIIGGAAVLLVFYLRLFGLIILSSLAVFLYRTRWHQR